MRSLGAGTTAGSCWFAWHGQHSDEELIGVTVARWLALLSALLFSNELAKLQLAVAWCVCSASTCLRDHAHSRVLIHLARIAASQPGTFLGGSRCNQGSSNRPRQRPRRTSAVVTTQLGAMSPGRCCHAAGGPHTL